MRKSIHVQFPLMVKFGMIKALFQEAPYLFFRFLIFSGLPIYWTAYIGFHTLQYLGVEAVNMRGLLVLVWVAYCVLESLSFTIPFLMEANHVRMCGVRQYKKYYTLANGFSFLSVTIISFCASSFLQAITFCILSFIGLLLVLSFIIVSNRSYCFSRLLTGEYVPCSQRDMMLDFVRAKALWPTLSDKFRKQYWYALPLWKWHMLNRLKRVNDNEAVQNYKQWTLYDSHELWQMMAQTFGINGETITIYLSHLCGEKETFIEPEWQIPI